MRLPLQSSGVLDRGGRPTVRDLLSNLAFNPADGTIRLNGDRIVMQRATFGAELKRELTSRLGRDEARTFLMRLGFQSGQSDAGFVRRTWPNLDIGDAFTAGTRLHTFSGVVRVETVHNEFDLRRKRFSAEFLWHDSVEAAAFRDAGAAAEPMCWTLVGYASGYATAFFDTLIVYKEVSCAAQGHAVCRVVGRPAEAWGAADPEVALFRERIAPRRVEGAVPRAAAPARDAATVLDDLILAPVRAAFDRVAPLPFPVLITGQPGTGRSRAARRLHRAAGAPGSLRHVFGAEVDRPLCEAIAQRQAGRRGGGAEAVLIEGIGSVPAAVQDLLARAVETGMRVGGPRVIALLEDGPMPPGHAPALGFGLSGLVLRMPPLAERGGERAALARALLQVLAERADRTVPGLGDDAAAAIERFPWPGNLHQMSAVLVAALAERPAGKIDAPLLEACLGRIARVGVEEERGAGATTALLGRLMAEDGFSLAALEAEAYRLAVERTGGNLSAAARMLGLSRAQLAYRLGVRETGEKAGS